MLTGDQTDITMAIIALLQTVVAPIIGCKKIILNFK
jgi:hypothetical protein